MNVSDEDPNPSGSRPRGALGAIVRKPSEVFYGWWIVVSAVLVSTIQTAVFNAGAQTLVLPLVREFDTTRTAISVAFALRRLEGGLTGPIEGYLIHWVGPRRYMMVGWVIFGLGFIAVSFSQNIYHFYAGFLLVTLGQSISGFLPIVTVLVNWFQRYRGRAIAMYQLGNSFGALLIPVFAWSVLTAGWRPTTFVIGILVMFIGVPLAAVMVPKPEDKGYYPDGVPIVEGDPPGGVQGAVESQLSVRQALLHRNFWLLGLSHSASLTGWGALQVHLIPALADMGLTEQMGAFILTVTLIIAGAGRLIGGFLGDAIGRRKVLVSALLGQAAAVVLLGYATNTTHVYLFAVIFGVSFGARGTLLTVLRGDVFGPTNFSRLAGLMDPISSFSVVISPLFAGWAFDTFSSYTGAFVILGILNALGALFVLGLQMTPLTAPTDNS